MEQALFDDLVQSLQEAKAIARGEAPASRRIKVKVTTPNAKAVPVLYFPFSETTPQKR